MDKNTVIFMVLLGLHVLPSCSPQRYHTFKDAKTWTEAQSYCREKYTDLVTINSEEDMVRLSHVLWSEHDEVWIGLYGDFNNWKWSLEREGFYEEGEAEFRNWFHAEPNTNVGPFVCVNIATSGVWSDYWCQNALSFVCYNEFSKTRYVYVKTAMNWTDAQTYCRKHYTDLASVRSSAENEEIKNLVESFSWIGLYRESWKWSDGQLMRMASFSNWDDNQPNKIKDSCVTTTQRKWKAQLCEAKYAFVCSEVTARRQVVKLMLTKSDSSVDLEEMQDTLLQQFQHRLKEHSLGEQVKLKWIKQPDGKIFHLKEREQRENTEEKSCILN